MADARSTTEAVTAAVEDAVRGVVEALRPGDAPDGAGDERRQEKAVDLAAAAPADVAIDSSVAAGPGYSPADARPGTRDELDARASGGGPDGAAGGGAQHGLGAHSHGAGVPEASRAERLTSFAVDDFPVPTGREEEWRFTPLGPLAPLFAPDAGAAAGLTTTVEAPDGVTHTRVGAGDPARGVAFVPGDRAAAVAYADAAGADVVRIAPEASLEAPVRVAVRSSGARGAGHLVVDAGPFSRATVVVHHAGSGAVASGVEVRVGDGAQLTVVSVQQWDEDAVHASQHDALVGRDATFKHVVVTLGGAVVRLGATVRYAGPGGDAELLGVYFADAGQHLEHRSFVDHAAPSCRSNVMYKGALQGATAHTVWVGDVLIRDGALGTDTYELNRNLVLTPGARADSVPNLEIETGEIVGAGHASATGRFDDEQLFYLQSRGIPEELARRLVVRAFFADVLQKIGVAEVTDALMAAIEAELEQAALPAVGTGEAPVPLTGAATLGAGA
ncbi:Fe-S cluster assembly protein SufD [Quadrisphaera sp. DSM 44207]|uniref:Fe-S cluster assembly protein SufD n=1 Tax=Quadrisphaera sp. DSM 44207 TaxID=1881057 RepID=UPI00088D767F|nr:Fe-S cluster assembly protein SufD [Quadrisphaera sp. DSM 44207]SDQ43944.1 Iron-regulated ABC transporter permease protein SufD [Quadrisphaera sp. DSM 44207]